MRTHVTWTLALAMMASPALTYGADTTTEKSETATAELRNVELTPAGSLEGQVLTPAGSPVASAKVVVRSQTDSSKALQEVVTDENGRFLVTGLKSGTCIVDSDENTYAVRVWKKGTAPPNSLRNVALVQPGNETVRGNRVTNWVRCMTPAQKIGLGLLVAAAIIIPIALDDDGS